MLTKSDNELLDLYRVGLDAMLDIAKTSLQGAERLRAQQIESVNEALSEAGETGKQFGSVKSFEDLLDVQTRLAPVQWEKAMGYWSNLWATTARSQAEIFQHMQSKVSDIGDACRATLDAAPRGSEPMVGPLKSAVTAMCSAYTLTARASEEAARMAVSQIESASARSRQAAQAGGQVAAQAAQASQSAAESRRKSAHA